MTHPSSGRSAAEDGGGETFLARARNGRSPGEESLTAAAAAQAIEAQPSFGQIKPSEAAWFARPTALRRRRGGYRVTRTRGRPDRAKQKKAWRSNGRPLHVQPPAAQRPIANRVAPDGGDASIRSKRCDDCYGEAATSGDEAVSRRRQCLVRRRARGREHHARPGRCRYGDCASDCYRLLPTYGRHSDVRETRGGTISRNSSRQCEEERDGCADQG